MNTTLISKKTTAWRMTFSAIKKCMAKNLLFPVCLFTYFLHFYQQRACDVCCALAFPYGGGHDRAGNLIICAPKVIKHAYCITGRTGRKWYYGLWRRFRSISNHKMYLGRITEANECVDGGAARQLLYFYALKSVPLAPISHYQSYECKICCIMRHVCVFER